MADGRFDDLLLALAQKHKNTEELTYCILSFFERRTDLFHIIESPNDKMGFCPGVAEKMFFKHYQFFQMRYFSRCQPQLLKRGDVEGGRTDAALQDAENTGTAADAGGTSSSNLGPESKPTVPPENARSMMRHISTWNGAVTDKYYWSQSLREVTVEIDVGDSCAKDIEVNATPTRLAIKCKGNTLLEGKLHEKVIVDNHIWHIDDKQLVLVLEKTRETWWKCVFEGDEEIDTTKVESTRAMEEYDGETQGAIRKIMFDQNQKIQGRPSSDQIRAADMMKDAWNAKGSPFRGTEFDPTLLNLSSPIPDEFFEDIEKRKIAEACKQKEQQSLDASRKPS